MQKLFSKLLGVLSIVALLLVSACSSSDNTSDKSSGDKVTIEYWHTYSDQEEKVLKEKIKPLFEKEHPNIKLKLTRMPYEGLKQQVIAGVSGNAAPDLMRMDIIWVPEFAKMGALKDVSSLKGFDEVKSSVFEGPLATNQFEDKYYGVPVNTNTKVAIYDKKVLDKAGVTETPKTMEELAAAAKKAKDAGAKGGITIGGANAWGVLPYFWSLGGKLTNEDYTKIDGYVNSPESVKALEQLIQWKKDGILSPTILGGEPGAWDGIKKHEYMMLDDGPWFYSVLMNEEKKKEDPLEYTVRGLIPEGPGGSRSVIGGEDLVIFANSKHPEEAWTFAKWMLTEEPQKLMADTGLIPTNKNAAQDPEFLKVPFVKEYVDQLETALPRTPIPQWSEFEQVFNLNLEKAIRGKMSAKQALDDTAKQGEAILKK
ncbi:extracellular solute-binding protein [Bacillus sp. NEB1478]|uniref:extracellular solute-binding protein n=1 Tax=Bacillus sp. NEB1478 TaxID=3073816 RepID=UPI0028730994|nr:extracellular solute-binding protein [Bacillus sp. NEB1478]WNB92359.1 extracellular solute-binding protein [Bacillus sp. NEB1478]